MIRNSIEQVSDDIKALWVWILIVDLVLLSPLYQLTALRIILVGSFLLFVPGYLFTSTIFIQEGRITLFERFVLSMATSLGAIVIVGFLLMRFTAPGVTFSTLVIGINVYAALLSVLIEIRRKELQPEERVDPLGDLRSVVGVAMENRSKIGSNDRTIQLAILLAVLLTISSVGYLVITPLPSEKFTEFYTVGQDESNSPLIGNASNNESVEVVVGVRNHEFEALEYGIQVQYTTDNDTRVQKVIPAIGLKHGESWEGEVRINVTERMRKVEFLLFLDEAPGNPVSPGQAYRYTWISLNNSDPVGSNIT